MTTEQTYDEQIHPLMAEIIRISKEHGICMFATFVLHDEDGEELGCTTCLPDGEGVLHEKISACEKIVYRKPEFLAFTIIKEG